MLPIETSKLEPAIRGGLFVFGARPGERVEIPGGDGESADVLELRESGDEFGFAFGDLGSCPMLACSDPEPGPVPLLLIR